MGGAFRIALIADNGHTFATNNKSRKRVASQSDMICEFGTRRTDPESNEVAPEKRFGYTPQGILELRDPGIQPSCEAETGHFVREDQTMRGRRSTLLKIFQTLKG